MEPEPWHVRRRRELEAAAPAKRKKAEPFVKVPMWWIEAASKATRSPATLVMIKLLRASWKARRSTFPLPNARLARRGVSRKVKHRVLRDLERAGLIVVDRPARKTPLISLVLL
jgi:hypothetical protein